VYPTLSALPEQVDLALIATPAPTVPGIIAECVEAGVEGAIIVSAGFKESGAAGAELEQHILEQARRGKLRIIGPNCLGVMSPLTGLNATFASTMAPRGTVGFISQSGALCTAVLDWSLGTNVGFSAFISKGCADARPLISPGLSNSWCALVTWRSNNAGSRKLT
jgi:acetyltransferase